MLDVPDFNLYSMDSPFQIIVVGFSFSAITQFIFVEKTERWVRDVGRARLDMHR
jgi:hypothetical protein